MTLFDPFKLRGVELPNRVVVSPMSQYRAVHGYANDWHLVHLGRFALGGAGLVFCEATAVEERGRRTHGDLGLWEDGQIDELSRTVRFLEAEGAVPGVQLAHAGRKASERRPWHGETPVDEQDVELRGEPPWMAVGPSPIPYAEGWPAPAEMTTQDIADVVQAFADAAGRAEAAGFKVLEVYAAHGFVAFARELKEHGVDMIDCSTGGIGGKERPRRMAISQGFQVPFVETVRAEAEIPTMAVGFIWEAAAANSIIKDGQADLVALARELLDDPNWTLRAARTLGDDEGFARWKPEFGWWLDRRDRLVRKLGIR